MKVDVTKTIMDISGTQPVLVSDMIGGELVDEIALALQNGRSIQEVLLLIQQRRVPLTLRTVSCNALLRTYKGEELSGEEKVKRYLLAQTLYTETTPDLKVEDIALLKKLIAKTHSPLVVGPVWKILDGE